MIGGSRPALGSIVTGLEYPASSAKSLESRSVGSFAGVPGDGFVTFNEADSGRQTGGTDKATFSHRRCDSCRGSHSSCAYVGLRVISMRRETARFYNNDEVSPREH